MLGPSEETAHAMSASPAAEVHRPRAAAPVALNLFDA
jgi:hypothetical protein